MSLLTDELGTISPLQIAALLGDRALVKHLLQKQCKVNWVWGPVTEWCLDLNGIDSAAAGSGDIMELIVHSSARRRTCEMLLDHFMNGFIYKLYIEKWDRFGRKVVPTLAFYTPMFCGPEPDPYPIYANLEKPYH